MPRVIARTKSRQGRSRSCERCGRRIEPGERYYQWGFRYGGTHYNCGDHPPRPSQLTQAKMAEVYAAIEAAEDGLPGAETIEDVRQLVTEVSEPVTQVAEEYREAAEPFGGAGENADRADELEGWAQELDGFDPDEPDEDEFDEEEHADEARERSDADEVGYSAAMQAIREEWEAEHEDDGSALEAARAEAEELLGGCPL